MLPNEPDPCDDPDADMLDDFIQRGAHDDDYPCEDVSE
jgi:hypothetical protein